MPVIIK